MINILLIDDKPESLYRSPGNEEIPVLDKGEGLFYEELKKHFNLKWLQSPEDIKDYRDFSNIIDNFLGHITLKQESFIPEIIVFDYNLGKGMNDTIELENEAEFKSTIPTFELGEKLNAKISRKKPAYIINRFNRDIQNNNAIEKKLTIDLAVNDIINNRNIQRPVLKEINDNLGCLAGGLIALQYKDHPCIGIPTTSKSEDDIKGTEATIFEWWLDYDFNGLFNLKHRTNPQWEELIPKAVANLRDRIKQLLRGGKISVSYKLLNDLTKGKLPEDRIFSFSSIYGVKDLPLDGLFIDKINDQKERRIEEWGEELITAYQEKVGFKYEEYETAKNASLKLIKAYQRTTDIDKRLRISELVAKKTRNELNDKEMADLYELSEYFGVNEQKIQAFIDGREAKYSNLESDKIRDFRKEKTGRSFVDRLIVLFTDLQLHKVYQNFCDLNSKSVIETGIISQLREWPSYEDLRFALFPIPFNPLVLPYHQIYLDEQYQMNEPFAIWDTHLGKKEKMEIPLLPKSAYPAQLSPGEKDVCKSFALELGLNQDYYPTWLKIRL